LPRTFRCAERERKIISEGIVMSGRALADQGLFFGVALIVGAVMSSTFRAENRIRWP
jgi:hypothetical protein